MSIAQLYAAGVSATDLLHNGDAGASCVPDTHGHCVTCGDEATPARVLRVDDQSLTAWVEIDGHQTAVDISLMEMVFPGQMLLVHGGVALGVADQVHVGERP